MIVSSASGVIEQELSMVTKTANFLDLIQGRAAQLNVPIAL